MARHSAPHSGPRPPKSRFGRAPSETDDLDSKAAAMHHIKPHEYGGADGISWDD